VQRARPGWPSRLAGKSYTEENEGEGRRWQFGRGEDEHVLVLEWGIVGKQGDKTRKGERWAGESHG
jgi:hypothetical protein